MPGPDDASILLNISEMIDLAIGTPECGVVDFNMLQTVLHCLAQQLRISAKNVELRGSVANLPAGRDTPHTVVVNEYEYEIDAAKTQDAEKPVMKITTTAVAEKTKDPDTILIVERLKKREPRDAREYSPVGRTVTPGSTLPEAGATTATASLQPQSSTEKLSLVTLSKFNMLENTVQDLRNRVYGSIPKNEQILDEVRSQTNLKAISDMWTSLNVSSRLEAAEEGIAKLSSLVQDLIGETTGLQESLSRLPSIAESEFTPSQDQQPPAADGTVSALKTSDALEEGTPSATGRPTSAGVKSTAGVRPTAAASAKSGDTGVKKQLDKLRADLDQLSSAFYKAMEDIYGAGTEEDTATGEARAPAVTGDKPALTTGTGLEGQDGTSVVAQGQGKKPSATGVTTLKTKQRQTLGASAVPAEIYARLNELEKKLNKCCDSIGKNDGVVQDQLNSFQDQLEGLMKQVTKLTEDLSVGKLSPDLINDLQGLMELFSTVQEMQSQIKDVHETALQLAAEKEDRQHNINALLEQIELLKTVKLDREDMIEAMAEKADLRMLARKVSHDQFDLACDDLSRGLEHALGKLNLQESLWQQALDDIQREIEMKLDKMELSPVKDFFNSKLRQLQENLKQMASLRREAEAAGTKRKLLRDVKCISCDAKAVMPTEAPSTVPVSRPLTATFSMKPYLSYELDAIRKTQQTSMPQRNMHDWEAIDKQMGSRPPPKPKSEGDKHLCNRYCGGSHTTTTPAQRVARVGHFIKQWGPDVLPLSSGLAAGDDGRLYKVTTTEAANVGPGGPIDTTCTPKPPKENSEKPKTPQKHMVISAECRCLDSGKGEY